jgi:hypothetical protein
MGASAQTPEHTWTEKSDWTWEQIFRFAFQKDYIPVMKGLAERIGQEKFVAMLQEITSGRAKEGMVKRNIPKRDLATLVGNLKAMPPLYQHAFTAEILQDTANVFEYRVSRCLWAKSFREENAGEIGYALICHPDFAIASGFNQKLKLTRTKTLMQGQECCHFRYEMEG